MCVELWVEKWTSEINSLASSYAICKMWCLMTQFSIYRRGTVSAYPRVVGTFNEVLHRTWLQRIKCLINTQRMWTIIYLIIVIVISGKRMGRHFGDAKEHSSVPSWNGELVGHVLLVPWPEFSKMHIEQVPCCHQVTYNRSWTTCWFSAYS